MFNKNERGFTLIELLIVIVIIGILAGVLITVLDPAAQQRKAREAALRTNVEKACMALHACGSTAQSAAQCDTYTEAGIRNNGAATEVPTFDDVPTGATYILDDQNTAAFAYVNGGAAAGATLYLRGTLGTCWFECDYNFGSATPSNPFMRVNPAVGGCTIGVQ